MGSSDKHKVCFDVLGVPVIIRALQTYDLCGAMLNIVVIGMMAENVMTTINRRFSGTIFAFQDMPRGTGDAARKGTAIIERMRFEGDVLVVAGDKVIAPGALRKLLKVHADTRADVTLATARRPPKSSAGILIKSSKGNITAILEESERQRLVALAAINNELTTEASLAKARIDRILSAHCSERTAVHLSNEIWNGEAESAELSRRTFESRFTEAERSGLIRAGADRVAATEVLQRCDQMNLSTYLFRAPVLCSALARLKSNRANDEEYLTDVFEILGQRSKPAKVVGCEIENPNDLMAFNNPQELLAIEEVYRRQQRRGLGTGQREHLQSEPRDRLQNGIPHPLRKGEAEPSSDPSIIHAANSSVSPGEDLSEDQMEGGAVAMVDAWSQMLEGPGPAARRQLRGCYGEDVPLKQLAGAITSFARRFGRDQPAAIVRSPGRINLMGRHIDHQGGTVNVMAVNREVVVVASAREDDLVVLANADDAHFAEQSFRISDLIAKLDWDDWQKVVDGPRIQRLLEAARGDWANYVKAAVLRLQEQFRDRQLRGLNMMVSGDIPMGAGLSSSSALVVATAEAVCLFNRLPVSGRRLVSLCGEGEWFVGTRGGAADHAAIKLSHKGCVSRVGFFPFRIEASARFFPGHDLVACNSGVYAGKSSLARNTFNAKVTAYHLGRIWFKMLRPDLASKIEHLRDLEPSHLGIGRKTLARLLAQLPERISRTRVQAAFPQMAPADRERIERLFASHDAPPGGYEIRGVVLFGLSEMARARRCLELLQQGQARELGTIMCTSHDGDRVSRLSGGQWRRIPRSRTNGELVRATERLAKGAEIADLPGAYSCSLPELDRIVDVATALPGVEGAQLAGAGLGGCIMVLVRKTHTERVVNELRNQGIQADVFRPIAGACNLRLV